MFERVPAGAGAYVIVNVIHDWDDDRSVTLLRNCREAMQPDGRVLLVQMVISPRNRATVAGESGGVQEAAELDVQPWWRPQGESPGRISKGRWRSPRRTARAGPVEVGCSNVPTNASWERATVPKGNFTLYRERRGRVASGLDATLSES